MTHLQNILMRIGYNDTQIIELLKALLKEIGFDEIKKRVELSKEKKDTSELINCLKELILSLEDKGYYRPDYPAQLIKLLVNGLNHKGEDIFAVLQESSIAEEEKKKEMEVLASCAAITQLGYILLSCLVSEVKSATAGPHVFLIIDGFSPDSKIFVDFSIDSIREIDLSFYRQKGDRYYLRKDVKMDDETLSLLTEYYSFFQVTTGIGLSHSIHNNMGIAYDTVGRYEDAKKEIEIAIVMNPRYAEAYNNLAVTLYKMGKSEEAINALKKAIELNSEYAEAHNNLGNIFASLKRYEDAIKELRQAIKLNPGFAGAHNNLGSIYAEQKRNDEAIKEFKEAIRLNPEHAFAHYNLGSLYAEQGKHGEAIKEFEEVLRLDPECTEAYYAIGWAYYHMGSYDKAINKWVRGVYLDPDMLDSIPSSLMLKVRRGVSRLKRGY